MELHPAVQGEGGRSAEEGLVERCRGGDRTAFDELVRRYQDRIFNLTLRLCGNHDDAAELTQEVFLKAWGSIGRFGSQARFYTWIYRIAVNLAIDLRRRQNRRPERPLPTQTRRGQGDSRPAAGDLLISGAPGPDARLSESELAAIAAKKLAALEIEQRMVIVLRDVEGLDYEQIADILGVPVGTVKSRLYRARMALRESLKPYLDQE
jgi:RNA polymerase sigma-70 factor (ECF subfamily)